MAERRGCKDCFKTLDPNDPDEELRTFVKCTGCGAEYHAVHWERIGKCLACSGTAAIPLTVDAPRNLAGAKKRADVGVKPTQTVTAPEDGAKKSQSPQWVGVGKGWAAYGLQALRAVFVGLVLVAVGSFIGALVPRFISLGDRSFQSIMDALFKQALPSRPLLVGAFVAGIITAWVFYPRANAELKGTPARVTRFIAGLVLLVGFNILYFRPLMLDVLNRDFAFRLFKEAWIAQAVSALLVWMFTLLQHRMAPITVSSSGPELHPVVANIYGWIRLFLAWLLIVMGIAFVVGRLLPTSLNAPFLAEVVLDKVRLTFTVPMVGAALAGVMIGALIYWAPPFRKVTQKLLLVRLLLVILAFIAIGLLYRGQAAQPVGYLNALILGGITAVLAAPLQRVLS